MLRHPGEIVPAGPKRVYLQKFNALGATLLDPIATFTYCMIKHLRFIVQSLRVLGLLSLVSCCQTHQALSPNKDALQFKTLLILSLIYPLLEEQ